MTPQQKARLEDHGQDWESIYEAEQVWSGNPNDALVATLTNSLSELKPGRALDVGCGEGADAIWLAEQGWQVTAIDVSTAALARGREAAQGRGETLAERIQWVASDVATAQLTPGAWDLVSAFYPALRKDSSVDLCALLASLVRPGGALLFVHHAEVDRQEAREHGFDPDDYVSSVDLQASLDAGWLVQTWEATRDVSQGRGAHHHRDIVLVARRVS